MEDGAGINYPDGKWGTTPLMAAAAPTQRLEVLKFLLRRKDLDKDAVNKRGMTALHQAAWYGQKDAVYLLLSMGASEEPKSEDGHTAADIARIMGHTETSAVFADAEEERKKNSIESADALRARLKSQSRKRSAKSLLALALPPPRPLYIPPPPSDPVEEPPQPQSIAVAEKQEDHDERKRPQFEGAGGGGPSKKWGHEIVKEGGSERQNKENEQERRPNDEKPEQEEAHKKPALPSRVEVLPPKEIGLDGKRREGESKSKSGAGPERTGKTAVGAVGQQQLHQPPPQEQQPQLEHSTPVMLAAEILGAEEGADKASAGMRRLGLGKRYEHTEPRSAEPKRGGEADAAQRPRAYSSMQLSSNSADSDVEGSFFLTQKPPSRPVSGVEIGRAHV